MFSLFRGELGVVTLPLGCLWLGGGREEGSVLMRGRVKLWPEARPRERLIDARGGLSGLSSVPSRCFPFVFMFVFPFMSCLTDGGE